MPRLRIEPHLLHHLITACSRAAGVAWLVDAQTLFDNLQHVQPGLSDELGS
jgi:hypothetical protein